MAQLASVSGDKNEESQNSRVSLPSFPMLRLQLLAGTGGLNCRGGVNTT
jgi:hypothetical protein